ncbi:hypothetical protein [Bradyrhizobium sp. AUGA SZCCT0160]|uniref:hypothetical protein n=1 Tax=Bradyrhizobium sp. AUGA SZCCT0160 TaxID=2807662 RepID=UPI001BAE51D2|nr:hypothetical protein [Bradyrhizobium sp. AUGA SZCCT0160]MBR1187318.1 hypothetical protein [Bradyrhizobium sp. AUGA SZCCT0160]
MVSTAGYWPNGRAFLKSIEAPAPEPVPTCDFSRTRHFSSARNVVQLVDHQGKRRGRAAA